MEEGRETRWRCGGGRKGGWVVVWWRKEGRLGGGVVEEGRDSREAGWGIGSNYGVRNLPSVT